MTSPYDRYQAQARLQALLAQLPPQARTALAMVGKGQRALEQTRALCQRLEATVRQEAHHQATRLFAECLEAFGFQDPKPSAGSRTPPRSTD